VGAASIAVGFLARLGGLGLILYLVPTTLIFHPFWTYTDAGERMMQMMNFLKNCGIVGGLAMIVANGAGRYSLDWAMRKPQEA
jgi:putative oxidoreductase